MVLICIPYSIVVSGLEPLVPESVPVGPRSKLGLVPNCTLSKIEQGPKISAGGKFGAPIGPLKSIVLFGKDVKITFS